MKHRINRIQNKILFYDFVFIGVSVLISYILALFKVRFRLRLSIFIILIASFFFIIGIIKQTKDAVRNKKITTNAVILYVLIIGLIVVFLMPWIFFLAVFSYKPEHTAILDNKKYVAVVTSFLDVSVDYYDYYGPFLMGTEIRVSGYFGSGGYDPFERPERDYNVKYIYYDSGKTVIKNNKEIIEDKPEDNSLPNESKNDYVPPKQVLYEQSFNQTILRFVKNDSVLGQKMIVSVERSLDSGENFYTVSSAPLQVNHEARFVFLNEDLGFVMNTNQVYLDNSAASMYVTHDGGQTFTTSKFKDNNKKIAYINIDSPPYYEENVLKLKSWISQWDSKNQQYQEELLFLKSDDNGLTWILEK